ncbi:MAG: ribosomal protein L11 methylase PrmA [Alteromonas naphthalenivorans]|jgi:ribosomal protein L11 methylase PrmA
MERVAASFRDPDGFLYWDKEKLYRKINQSYFKDYDFLKKSGLYKILIDQKLLVLHTEISLDHESRVIAPDLIPFVSYPYEWSFSQLKDAALLTLDIQLKALEHGMSLKDASVYNVQFKDGKPIFIDTLSFERYKEGEPWVAYRQFCQHFLAPLALMAYKDVRLNSLFKNYIDGVPLDLAATLLPSSSYLSLSLLLHVHLHARAQKKYEDTTEKTTSKRTLSLHQIKGLVDSLRSGIAGCTWKAQGTEWVDYYQDDSYTEVGLKDKQRLVEEFLHITQPKTVWDLGGNDGFFSRLAAKISGHVVCFDIDPACVENNYLQSKKNNETKVFPLLLDLTNPTPAVGWGNAERLTIDKRGNPDCVLALALVHHLAISNNVPLDYIASYFASLGQWLIIEFVPKSDKKVKKLLATRADIFTQYTQEGFEQAFNSSFEIQSKEQIADSDRVLYLMRRK